jgi:general L-amino acid transport system ATP-binding protein
MWNIFCMAASSRQQVKGVLDVMRELAASGMTMICVTHEMGFARNVADRVVFLTDGCVCKTGQPSDFFSCPTTPQAIKFLGHVLAR